MNFSWSNNQAQNQAPRPQNPPDFQNQASYQAERKPNLEEALAKFIVATDKRMSEQDKLLSQVDMNVKAK